MRTTFGRALIVAGVCIVVAAGAATLSPDESRPASGDAENGGLSYDLAAAPVLAAALARHEGKVVLIDAWTTWCGNCSESLEELESLQREFGAQGFQVVAVSVDRGKDAAAVSAFARKYAATIEVVHDPTGATMAALQAFGVPTSVLIARDGRVVDFRPGFSGAGHANSWSAGNGRRSIEAAVAQARRALRGA